MPIKLLNRSDAAAFAAEELKSTFSRMGIGENEYSVSVGLFSDFSIPLKGDSPLLDDETAVDIRNGNGYIAGSNPRSILFAAYRYLEACGVKYIRPGANGTRYPKRSSLADLKLKEAPSVRHRSICIEGAVSLENVLDLVDFMPKLGFNSYFIQFRNPFIFFDRWYSHRKNPFKKPEPISRETSAEYTKTVIREVKKRGLLLEAMGHGWTCEPFGVPHTGWDKADGKSLPKEYLDICAELNGERKVFNNSPLATQICLSNPWARKTMNESVLKYIRENPEADIVHYWLGDYYNNVCECKECRKLHASDYYVMLLNELDGLLTENGISTRIVFANYYNNSIPPKRERLRNQDRFIMLYAPITRTYSEPFPDNFPVKEIPPYVCNRYELPLSTADNLAYLYAWRQQYSGDTVDFDYHLMWDHLLDGSGENISKILCTDIKRLKALTADGFISCQLQRSFFPTSLAVTVMGKTLWNTETRFEDIRSSLYAAAFGGEYLDLVTEYFSVLSEAFDIGAMRCHKPFRPEKWKRAIEWALSKMTEMQPVIENGCESPDPVTARSWQLLKLHQGAYAPILHELLFLIDKNYERASECLGAAVDFVWRHEDELQDSLDSFFFDEIVSARINLEENLLFPENGN